MPHSPSSINQSIEQKNSPNLSNSIRDAIDAGLRECGPVVPNEFVVHWQLKHQINNRRWYQKMPGMTASTASHSRGVSKISDTGSEDGELGIPWARRNRLPACRGRCACRRGGPCRSGGGERRRRSARRRRCRPWSSKLRGSISQPFSRTFSAAKQLLLRLHFSTHRFLNSTDFVIVLGQNSEHWSWTRPNRQNRKITNLSSLFSTQKRDKITVGIRQGWVFQLDP